MDQACQFAEQCLRMQNFSIAPAEIVRGLLAHRSLLSELTKREILGRYKGSVLGGLWTIFQPIMMLTVYTLVFSVIFKARWGETSTSRIEFALMLFVGLMIYNFFAECIGRAPVLVLSNANYVKKVVFPLELLPWVSIGSALFNLVTSCAVWTTVYIAVNGLPAPAALLLPLVLVPLILSVLGISWILSSLGVFLRDVSQVVGVFISALMFLSPIFYPVKMFPADYQWLLVINPLTPVIESARDLLLLGRMPDWIVWTESLFVGALVAWVGFAWFQKTRKGFADVL